jgi:hypothetical protein
MANYFVVERTSATETAEKADVDDGEGRSPGAPVPRARAYPCYYYNARAKMRAPARRRVLRHQGCNARIALDASAAPFAAERSPPGTCLATRA